MTSRTRQEHFKTYLWEGAELIGRYDMPRLQPTQFVPREVRSFNERKQLRDVRRFWIDCFIEDYQFERLWNSPRRYVVELQRYAGFITPDFSMYPELPQGINVYNCMRNRILAYFYQRQGVNIVPVASWCREDDFSWCFDGLPAESSIAISTNGCCRNTYSRRILKLGVEALQRKLRPSTLIVCGRPLSELSEYGNVVYYPSYSERWRARARHGQ